MNFSKEQKRAIFLTAIAILFLIILFIIIAITIIARNSSTNKNIDITTGYSSIKDIIEHYDSIYIKDEYDKDLEYPIKVNVEFKHNLYENEESNETFFNSIIRDIAGFVNYTNFEIHDEKKNIKIQVVCSDRKIQKILVNGIEDYFIHMNSQLELSKYEEVKKIDIEVNAEVLRNLISNSWRSDIDFGTRDEVFKNYFIFFDEGVEYRKIGSVVYNIVFTQNYRDYVMNYITPKDSLSSIKAKLGEPAFEDDELNVIGYKGNDFYAFFNGEEISIYRCMNCDYTDFWKLIDRFIDEDSKMTFKEFMNELTYIWKDYSDYDLKSDCMFISYPNKGIDVKLNYDGVSGIIVYNNISEDLEKVSRYLEHSEFISNLKLDDVFEAEKRRVRNNNKLIDSCKEYQEYMKEKYTKEDLELIGESIEYDYYFDLDNNEDTISVYFIPKNKENPKRELNETVYRYFWLDGHRFLYSILGKGIYIYDLYTGQKSTVIEGTDDFYIKSYEGDILTYDNMRLTVQLY